MKISEILNEMTSAGAIATVAQPIGKMIRRNPKKRKKTTESITVQNPKDLESLVAGVRSINSDTVVFDDRRTVDALQSFLKKHGYSNKNNVWRKDGNAIGIEWNDNEMKGHAVMWSDSVAERKLSKAEIRKRDKYADDLPDAEFKKRYGKDWEAVKYGTATNMAKKKTKESVQLDEYRATNILGFMSGLRKHPDVEKIVDIVSQADGQSALVRTKDGNAYEIQVRQAGMSQHPSIQKHTKKNKE